MSMIQHVYLGGIIVVTMLINDMHLELCMKWGCTAY